jgi:hypothetical protein
MTRAGATASAARAFIKNAKISHAPIATAPDASPLQESRRIEARILSVRAALGAIRSLGTRSDAKAEAPYGALIQDMEAYLARLEASVERQRFLRDRL